MCTAMSLISKKNNVYFCRTMDFSYDLNPEVYFIPKNYTWISYTNDEIVNKYKFLATGQNIGKLAFADGMNEIGLSIAALYFQEYAHYDEVSDKESSIAAIDVVNYILGNCANIEEAIYEFNKINIIGIEDEVTNSIAPLHWIISYKDGQCITVEKTLNGLSISDNMVGILANSPNFEWQIVNLNNYLNLSNKQEETSKLGNLTIKPFGQGSGSIGLPGDYTSPSRFVRLTYGKEFTIIPDNNKDIVNTCFNIMKSVFIPKGVVLTKRETFDYTQYTVVMNINDGEYYFNTYNNNQIIKVNINDIISSDVLSIIKLNYK